MKKDIFDLLKELEEKAQQIQEVFLCSDFLDTEISIVWDIIDENYGITDTDASAELYFKFGEGNLTKKQLISKLKKTS